MICNEREARKLTFFLSRSDSDIVFVRSATVNLTRGSWSTVKPIDAGALNDVGDDLAPSITSQGPIFSVAWQTDENMGGMLGTDWDVVISESADGGSSWTIPLGVESGSDDNPDNAGSDYLPRMFSTNSGMRGMAKLKSFGPSVLAWGIYKTPAGQTVQQCPKFSGWSSPALVDDKFFSQDLGTDESEHFFRVFLCRCYTIDSLSLGVGFRCRYCCVE